MKEAAMRMFEHAGDGLYGRWRDEVRDVVEEPNHEARGMRMYMCMSI